jgi:hypothetical protein
MVTIPSHSTVRAAIRSAMIAGVLRGGVEGQNSPRSLDPQPPRKSACNFKNRVLLIGPAEGGHTALLLRSICWVPS